MKYCVEETFESSMISVGKVEGPIFSSYYRADYGLNNPPRIQMQAEEFLINYLEFRGLKVVDSNAVTTTTTEP